jgi:hypothetical protein
MRKAFELEVQMCFCGSVELDADVSSIECYILAVNPGAGELVLGEGPGLDEHAVTRYRVGVDECEIDAIIAYVFRERRDMPRQARSLQHRVEVAHMR